MVQPSQPRAVALYARSNARSLKVLGLSSKKPGHLLRAYHAAMARTTLDPAASVGRSLPGTAPSLSVVKYNPGTHRSPDKPQDAPSPSRVYEVESPSEPEDDSQPKRAPRLPASSWNRVDSPQSEGEGEPEDVAPERDERVERLSRAMDAADWVSVTM